MRAAMVCAALLAGGLLGGCGEQKDVVVYKQGKYQGKPDTRPWDNEPADKGGWTKGDQASWEAAIKQRQANQNDYVKVP